MLGGDDVKLQQEVEEGSVSSELGISSDLSVDMSMQHDDTLSEQDIGEVNAAKTYGISPEAIRVLNVLLAHASKSGDFSEFFQELSSRLIRDKNKRIRRECGFLILQNASGKYSIQLSIDGVRANCSGLCHIYICDLGSIALVFPHESCDRVDFMTSIANSNFVIRGSRISKLSVECIDGQLIYHPVFFKVESLQYAMEHEDRQAVDSLCRVLMRCETGRQIVKRVTELILYKIDRNQSKVDYKILGCLDHLLALQSEGFNLQSLTDLNIVQQFKAFTHTVCSDSSLLGKVCKTPYENIVRTMCLLELREVEQLEPVRSAKQYRRRDSYVVGSTDMVSPDMVHKVYGPDEDNIVFLMMQSDCVDVIEKLFSQYNIDIATQNAYGYTAMHFAAMYNAKNCAEFLLKYNTKPVILRKPVKSKVTPSHLAAASGAVDVLRLLEKYNPRDIRKRDSMGRSIVHHAAMATDSRALSFCVEIGLDINDQVKLTDKEGANNSEGCTALHFAVEGGNLEIVNYLLSCKDIDLSIQNVEGYTPITSTMRTRASNGNTLLHHCVVCDNPGLLKKAIDLGWNTVMLVRNAAGKTAFDLAIEKGRVECAVVLLEYYYGVKYKDKLGNTIFAILDPEGNTLIHQAASFDSGPIMKRLLSYNEISLKRVNRCNETPLDVAIKYNNASVIDCLLADSRQSLFDLYGNSYVIKLMSKGLMTRKVLRIINKKYAKIRTKQFVKSSLFSMLVFLFFFGIIVFGIVTFPDKVDNMLAMLGSDILFLKVFLAALIIFSLGIICIGCCVAFQLRTDLSAYKKLFPMNPENVCSTTAGALMKSTSSTYSDYISIYNDHAFLETPELSYESKIEISNKNGEGNTDSAKGCTTTVTGLSVEDCQSPQINVTFPQ
ncbi:hypothetical protein EDL79_01225 [Ehrlichia ruminantium]|uniref:Uncharacterized protein n=1 Tax=Ehrlichia ruminantium TaxID=779 RepID=A0AAE6UID2_EHRRU|nr:ankyrin repeat domain-containing protein [Ehrlichia ruminantium]QGR03222.1 hypothetical protein EDL80_01225 [Ehrlichia ruminantium]QGR04147.1 hypothetical protein EDL79_01225 [Ehrlichia ruminantium]